VHPQMGSAGRSWIGLVTFWALAILVAALGPSAVPESPVVDVVEADVPTDRAVAVSGHTVVSR